MTPRDGNGEGGGPPDEPANHADEPIEALGALDYPVGSGFLARVRRSIGRRSFVSQLLSVSWHLPRLVLWEFLQMVMELFAPDGKRKGGSS